MKSGRADSRSVVFTTVSWVLGTIFLVIGVLNVVLVHPVPGVFYLLLSYFYLPAGDAFLRRRFGLAVPLTVKVISGLIVLWGTLAMSELADRID